MSESDRSHADSKEAALQAARMALDYLNIEQYNAGLYREYAELDVILVTDEEDQSDGSAEIYVDYFKNLKGEGSPDLLNISAIAGPPPDGCDTAEANSVDHEAVTLANGQFRSICSADWSDLIGSLGLDVFNARRQFPLSRPAETASISVEICDDDGNGNPINCRQVANGSQNGWTFDSNTNSVIFHGDAIPQSNQHIIVDYSAICF